MRLLVGGARISIGFAALIVLAVFIVAGGGYAEGMGQGFAIGAIIGGILGLLVAGSVLGLAAAVVDMHQHTRQMIVLLKEQNNHLAALVRTGAPGRPIMTDTPSLNSNTIHAAGRP